MTFLIRQKQLIFLSISKLTFKFIFHLSFFLFSYLFAKVVGPYLGLPSVQEFLTKHQN